MRKIIFILFLLSTCLSIHAQPNLQQLEEKEQENAWLTDPPYTLLRISSNGGGTTYNQHGQMTK